MAFRKGGTKNYKKENLKMFGDIFSRFCNPGCGQGGRQNSSCDVLWIIVLLMIVLRGGMFGLDICTILILAIVFGKDFLCRENLRQDAQSRCC